jgi:putative membrane protein
MLWIKALHLLAVIAWVAAMTALPQLFARHAASSEPAATTTLLALERRWHAVMNLASAIAIVTGAWMLWSYAWAAYGHQGWLHAKLTLAALAIAFQGWCSLAYRDFRLDRNRRAARTFQLMEPVPLILTAAIVVLVIVRPF